MQHKIHIKMKTIKNIIKILNTNKLTNRELAARIGVSEFHIGRVLKGFIKLSAEELNKIAEALNMTTEELINYSEVDHHSPVSIESELIKLDASIQVLQNGYADLERRISELEQQNSSASSLPSELSSEQDLTNLSINKKNNQYGKTYESSCREQGNVHD